MTETDKEQQTRQGMTTVGLCPRCGSVIRLAESVKVNLTVATRDKHPKLPKGSLINVRVVLYAVPCAEYVLASGTLRTIEDGKGKETNGEC